MGDIINFGGASKAKRDSQQKDKEIQRLTTENEQLKKQNQQLNNALSKVTSVNDMLKIQLNDLLNGITALKHHLNGVESNVHNLKDKLPNIKVDDPKD